MSHIINSGETGLKNMVHMVEKEERRDKCQTLAQPPPLTTVPGPSLRMSPCRWESLFCPGIRQNINI